MGDTDSHGLSDFVARRAAARGRGMITPTPTPRHGQPPTQRDSAPGEQDESGEQDDIPGEGDGAPVARDGVVLGLPDPTRRAFAALHAVDTPALPRARTDRGLFGPTTITWRLHCDPLMGLAGLRALLLQALHPLTMAAVDAHNRQQWDPWLRLARTAEYVGVTTYGTAAEAMLAGSRLRAVHARIYGTTRQGRLYTAEDANLLAWVHACLVASFLEIVTRGGLPLSRQEQDAYIGEQVRAAMLVGLEPDEVPHDRASLVAYFRQLRPTLAVTPPAQAAALTVAGVRPPQRRPGAPAPDRPAWAGVAGLAFATLPPWARRLYALPELTGAAGLGQAAATVALRELRTSMRTVQSGTDLPG
jgi:uncharacterized protein (DUF2236 family)